MRDFIKRLTVLDWSFNYKTYILHVILYPKLQVRTHTVRNPTHHRFPVLDYLRGRQVYIDPVYDTQPYK